MKKYILFVFMLVLAALAGCSQTSPSNPYGWTYPFQRVNWPEGFNWKAGMFRQVLVPPAPGTLVPLPATWRGDSLRGAFAFYPPDSSWYGWNGSRWIRFDTAGAAGAVYVPGNGIQFDGNSIRWADILTEGFTNVMTGSSGLRFQLQTNHGEGLGYLLLDNDNGWQLMGNDSSYTSIQGRIGTMRAADYLFFAADSIYFKHKNFTRYRHRVTSLSKYNLMLLDSSSGALTLTTPGNLLASAINYPYTANRYLNGYGSWVQLNSDSLAEGSTNLFYSNARARAAISLTTTGSSGAATYDNSTGILNIPNYSGGGGGGITGIGPFSTVGNANGATISGSNLILHPATSTTPGGLSIGEQNIPGFKYFDEILTTKLARYTESNTGTASIYLRDGGAAGRIGIGKQLTSMHFFVPTDFSSYRWYGGGDFNNSAADWMSLSSSLLDIGVNARLSGYLITKNANSNTPTDQILIRGVVGGTSNCGIGKGIADMQFYSNNGYGFRWYGGGQFNNSAANWMKLDEQSLTVGAFMRLSGNGGYASINEYTSNSLLIAGSLVGFGSPIQFNGPGYGRGRGEMTANGQVIFSDVNQNNTVRPNSTFTVVSNSRGSSPFPVLIQSQRLAMTMSAQDIGLHVYQSDGTEGVWVYKSTGWQFAY